MFVLVILVLVIRVLVAPTDTREEFPQDNAIIDIPMIVVVYILSSSIFFLLWGYFFSPVFRVFFVPLVKSLREEASTPVSAVSSFGIAL